MLKPALVLAEQARLGVSTRQKNRRKNRAFRRQGEWFFIKAAGLEVDPALILYREPIRRGGGKPHLIEQVYRRGGEDVYVHRDFPNGISMGEYRRIMAEPENRRSESSWRRMKRNPELYARGTVRHPDHRTITLHDWHRVLMNRENESSTRQFVAFLD
jgi:hypothetical protein